MQAQRKQRLILIALLISTLSGAVFLGLNALQQNINLFFSPSEVLAGKAPLDKTFRVGGIVVEHSIQRGKNDLSVTFQLTDTASTLLITYTGILPDLFREGQGIVALGGMQNGVFIADQVLAKHDENYMPPEVSDALNAANRNRYVDQPSY